MNAAEAVFESARTLAGAGVDSARLDAELILCFVLGWERVSLYACPERELSPAEELEWRPLVARRASREPLPYLLGRREFFGRDFIVTPAVLIPRPETELLIEGLAGRRAIRGSARIADVGTGSGCIGLTLAMEHPEAILILTDSSPAALEVAGRNAELLGIGGRVETRRAAFPDGLDDVEGRLDVLVSNPPYVAHKDRLLLPPEVAQFEPEEALFSGKDGLDLLDRLLARGRTLLRPGGWIALEFGIGQSEPLRCRAIEVGYDALALEPDLAGIPRALFARSG